ncbi:MAG TPA: ABC transporter ATP-binding protein [Pirellulales bacterium]|nr:ABC transporter ATP-binding protein [Pirellulales bacterium]
MCDARRHDDHGRRFFQSMMSRGGLVMTATMIAEFERVSKHYQGAWPGRAGVDALRRVTLSIPSGEVFGLLGPNRAGKSTLVKVLLTICPASSGRITRLGRPCDDRSTLAQVGYVHESQSLPGYLTARGLLRCYGALTGLASVVVRRRSDELLERVGLADRGREPISRYSKGMLQRLALAQALVNEPELLVLDEPTEGMDLFARRLVHETIREQRRRGRSVILVSHAIGDVEQLCDRVAVLREGKLVFDGQIDELTHSAEGAATGPLERALEPLYDDRLLHKMPPACPVEYHAGSYNATT